MPFDPAKLLAEMSAPLDQNNQPMDFKFPSGGTPSTNYQVTEDKYLYPDIQRPALEALYNSETEDKIYGEDNPYEYQQFSALPNRNMGQDMVRWMTGTTGTFGKMLKSSEEDEDKLVYPYYDKEKDAYYLRYIGNDENKIKKLDAQVLSAYGPKPFSKSFMENLNTGLYNAYIGSTSMVLNTAAALGTAKNALAPDAFSQFLSMGLEDMAKQSRERVTGREVPQSQIAELEPFTSSEGIASGLGQAIISISQFGGIGKGIKTLASTFIKNPKALYTISGYGAGMILNTGDAYQSALQGGLDKEDAAVLSLGVGLVNSFIEQKFGSNVLMKYLTGNRGATKEFTKIIMDEAGELTEEALNKATPRILSRIANKVTAFTEKPIIGQAFEEGAEEFMQTMTQKTGEVLYDNFFGEGKKIGEGRFGTQFDKDTWTEAFGSAAIGAITGGIGGFGMQNANKDIYSAISNGDTKELINVIDAQESAGKLSPEQAGAIKTKVIQVDSLWNKNRSAFANLATKEESEKLQSEALDHINSEFGAKQEIVKIEKQIAEINADPELADAVKTQKIDELKAKINSQRTLAGFHSFMLSKYMPNQKGIIDASIINMQDPQVRVNLAGQYAIDKHIKEAEKKVPLLEVQYQNDALLKGLNLETDQDKIQELDSYKTFKAAQEDLAKAKESQKELEKEYKKFGTKEFKEERKTAQDAKHLQDTQKAVESMDKFLDLTTLEIEYNKYKKAPFYQTHKDQIDQSYAENRDRIQAVSKQFEEEEAARNAASQAARDAEIATHGDTKTPDESGPTYEEQRQAILDAQNLPEEPIEPELSQETISEQNKNVGNPDISTEPSEDYIQNKKSNILTLAYLDIAFLTYSDGVSEFIQDLTDDYGNKISTNKRDPMINSNRFFNPGDEIEIYLDTEYATETNTPITITKAPFGIRRKGQKAAAYVHLLQDDTMDSEVDPNISKYIRRDEKGGNSIQKTETQRLRDLRASLFDALVVNNNATVPAVITDKSVGHLNTTEDFRPVLDQMGDGTKPGLNVTFGIINHRVPGSVVAIGDFLMHPGVNTSTMVDGATIALIPSNQRNSEGQVFHTPVYIDRNTLSEDDAQIVYHILEKWDYYNTDGMDDLRAREGIIGALGIKNAQDLLLLLVNAGQKSNKLRIEEGTGGSIKVHTSFAKYQKDGKTLLAPNVNESLTNDPKNKERLLEKIRNLRYHTNSRLFKSKQVPILRLEDGKIVIKGNTRPYVDVIAERGTTDVQGRKVQGFTHNELVFWNQSTIAYSLKEEPQTEVTSSLEDQKADIERRRQEELEENYQMMKTLADDKEGISDEEFQKVVARQQANASKIDKKYDAELANLEKPSETPYTPETDEGTAISKDIDAFLDEDQDTDRPDNLVDLNTPVYNAFNASRINDLSKGVSYTQMMESLFIGLPRGYTDLLVSLNQVLKDKSVRFETYSDPNSDVLASAKSGIKYSISLNLARIANSQVPLNYIILHELLHLGTQKALNKPETAAEIEFNKNIKELYNFAKKKLKNQYGFKNEKEFVSEGLTNPEFIKELQGLEYSERKTIWDKFTGFFKDLFGIKGNSIHTLLSRYTNQFLETGLFASTDDLFVDNLESQLIPGLYLHESQQAINTINGLALDFLAEGKLSKSETYKKVYDKLANTRNAFTQMLPSATEVRKKNIQRYIDNINKVIGTDPESEVYKKLIEKSEGYINQLAGALTAITESDDDRAVGKESWGRDAFTINSKSTASKRMKLFLSFIKNTRYVKNPNGTLKKQEIPSFLGTSTYVPFDTLYNTLAHRLANLKTEEILPTLARYGVSNSVLNTVYEKLVEYKNTGSKNYNYDAIYNEFISNFVKQHLAFFTFQYRKSFQGAWGSQVMYSNRDDADKIVMKGWKTNFQDSQYVKEEDEILVVNSKKAEGLADEFAALKKGNAQKEVKLNRYFDMLDEVGIKVSPEAKILILNPPKNRPKYALNSVENAIGIIFDRMAGRIEQKQTQDPADVNNPFALEGSSLELLAELHLQVSDNIFSLSFRNEEGKTIYSVSQQTPMSKKYQNLVNLDINALAQWKANPFTANGYILANIDNTEFRSSFEIGYFSNFNQQGKGKLGKPFNKMSPQEREYAAMMGFMNNGAKFGYFIDNTNSDKPTQVVIKASKIEGTNLAKVRDQHALDLMYDHIFEPEAKRILKAHKDIKTLPKEKQIYLYHYDKKGNPGGAFNFHLLPEMNTFMIKDQEGIEIPLSDIKRLAYYDQYKTQIQDKLWEIIKANIDLQHRTWSSLSLADGKYLDPAWVTARQKAKLNSGFDGLVSDYVLNYMLVLASSYQLFSNDPAFTGNIINQSKRNAAKIAPSMQLNQEGNFDLLALNDQKVTSKHIDELYQALRDNGVNVKNAEKITDYRGIDSTDAQGMTSIQMYRKIMHGWGRLTERVDTILKKAQAGYEISPKEYKEVLGPQKPIYVGDVWNEELGLLVPHYIKFSIFPLIKSLTKDYQTLDNLRDFMEKNDTGIAVYLTAYKEGANNLQNLYSPDGALPLELNKNQVISLPFSGLGMQQEVPYDDEEDEILAGTQEITLITGDLLDPSITSVNAFEFRETFHTILSANTNQAFEQYVDNFGVVNTSNGYEIEDLTKVQKVLLEEDKTGNLNDNLKQILDIETVNGVQQFAIPPYFSPAWRSFQSLLNSVITNRIIKQHFTGHSYVQGSNNMFKQEFTKEQMTSYEEFKAKNKDLDKQIQWVENATKTLNFFRYDKGNNKILHAEVLLPSPYAKYLKENQTLSPEALTAMGFRIPTQGYNSLAHITIKGFLPPEMGHLVIVPSEFLKQMGSDFDVDKLYMYFYNLELNGDIWEPIKYYSKPEDLDIRYAEYLKLSKKDAVISEEVTEETEDTPEKEKILTKEEFALRPIPRQHTKAARDNELLRMRIFLLENPQLLYKLINPNGLDDIKRVNKHLEEIAGKTALGNPLTRVAQDQIYESNLSGKMGVAIMSSLMTMQAQLQYTDYKIRMREGDILQNVGIKFLDEKGELLRDNAAKLAGINEKTKAKMFEMYPDVKHRDLGLISLNKVRGLINNSLISDILQQIQTASVDNAKEGEISKANLNTLTFNVASLLAYSGIDSLDYIIGFLRQPSIMRFVQFKQRLQSSLNDFEEGEIDQRAAKMVLNEYKDKLKEKSGTLDYQFNGIDIKAFGYKDLEDAIVRETQPLETKEDAQAFYTNQLEALNAFLRYNQIAQDTTTLTSITNLQSKGLGKAYYDIQKRVRTYDRISQNKLPNTVNGDEVFFKMYPDKGVSTYVGNLLYKALYPARDINGSSKLSYYSFKFYQDIISSLFESWQKNQVQLEFGEEDNKLIENELINYVTSTIQTNLYPENTQEYKKKLLFDTETNQSLGTRILEYRKTGKKAGKWLLDRLEVIKPDRVTDETTIKYYRNQVEKTEEPLASEALVEMLNSSDPDTQRLGKDLVGYTYTTTGGNLSAVGFAHIVPIMYLKEQGFGTYFNTKFKGDALNEEFTTRFIDQFFRNNPEKAKKITNYDPLRDKDKIIGFTTEDVSLPKYVSKYNSALPTKNKFELFVFDGMSETGKRVYQRIEELGKDQIPEYNMDLDIPTGTSIFAVNNLGTTKHQIRMSTAGPSFTKDHVPQKAEETKENSTEFRGNLKMQPDNIEKILSGEKTITNRVEKLLDGLYTLPNGVEIQLALLGEARINLKQSELYPEEIIITADNGVSLEHNLTKDTLAQAEGFKNWADFEANNKFSKNFINGTQSRYLYNIKLISKLKEDTSTPINYFDTLSKEEQDLYNKEWDSGASDLYDKQEFDEYFEKCLRHKH